MEEKEIYLGDLVRDTVTGLSGTAVAFMEQLHGASKWQVQPKEMSNGLPVNAYWIYEGRAELVEPGAGRRPPRRIGMRRHG